MLATTLADLGGVPSAHPPKGPDSFVLTYKIFETLPPQESMPPYEVHAPPPTGNPGSATAQYDRARKYAMS